MSTSQDSPDKPIEESVSTSGEPKPASRGRIVGLILAMILLCTAAFAVTCTKEYNKDIFWHLACGKWMFEHGKILDSDPFTADPEKPNAPWLNIHWGFQIAVTWLHEKGGFDALSYAKAAIAALTLVVLVLGVRNPMGAGWLVFCGLLMLMACADRIRMRPEILTLLYSMLTIVIIERVRQGAKAYWLWVMVPLMVVWANMHGLYIIGLALMWSAVLGAVIDRLLRKGSSLGGSNLLALRAILPMAAATVAVVVTPWGIAGVFHPLLLWTRISGEASMLYQKVSELTPVLQNILSDTFHAWSTQGSEAAIKVLLAGLAKQAWALAITLLAAVALITHSAMAKKKRISAVPISHIIWMLAFFYLWWKAERNIIFLIPVAGYLLAWHGGRVLRQVLDEQESLRKMRLPAVATALVVVALAYFSWDYATERAYLQKHQPLQSGPGLLRQVYGVGLAQYMAKLPAPGAILCQDFGDAGPFLYYTYPEHLSWMDGRLEAHEADRLLKLVEFSTNLGPPPEGATTQRLGPPLRDSKAMETWQLPDSVRYVMIGPGANVKDSMSLLAQSPRFRLVCVDQGGAVFGLKDFPGGGTVPTFGNRDQFDRPLGADGLVEGVPAAVRTWWHRNPFSLHDRMADIFTALGGPPPKKESREWSPTQQDCELLAIRYRAGALAEALENVDETAAQLGGTLAIWAEQNQETAEGIVPVDLDFARANYLLSHIAFDRAAMPAGPGQFTPGLGWEIMQMSVLVTARQFDAAERAYADHLKRMPAWLRGNLPTVFVQKEQLIRENVTKAESAAKGDDVKALSGSPVQKALLLAGPKIGLIDRAIAEIQKVSKPTAEGIVTLGDLLLRKGQSDKAREKYRMAAADAQFKARAELGLALCDWVEGKYYPARDALAKLAGLDNTSGGVAAVLPALPLFYLAQVQEQLGLYEDMAVTLKALDKAGNSELTQKLQLLRLRHPRP